MIDIESNTYGAEFESCGAEPNAVPDAWGIMQDGALNYDLVGVEGDVDFWLTECDGEKVKLYTHHQAKVKRLTSDEIINVAKECGGTLNKATVEFDFAVAIMDACNIPKRPADDCEG